jgi:hypothetical protein
MMNLIVRKCQRCESERVVRVHSHGVDRNNWKLGNGEWSDGYLPHDLGIGGGDDLEMSYCLECGQIQGKFPLPPTELEVGEEEDDE